MATLSKPEILQALLALGFHKPSKIQGTGIPLMLSDPPQHLLAQSQSGTGKTAAFAIGMLSRIDLTKPDVPQALALAPSRELARQIEDVIGAIGRFCTGLKVAAAVPGGLPRGERVQANVVVGTPGTVFDIIKRRQLDSSNLKLLVIDEADNMLDEQGLGDQCMRIKRYVIFLSPGSSLPLNWRDLALAFRLRIGTNILPAQHAPS